MSTTDPTPDEVGSCLTRWADCPIHAEPVQYFITGTMLGSYVVRYTLFMLAVVAHRGADFAREQSMVSRGAAAAVPRLDEFVRRRL